MKMPCIISNILNIKELIFDTLSSLPEKISKLRTNKYSSIQSMTDIDSKNNKKLVLVETFGGNVLIKSPIALRFQSKAIFIW